MKCALVSSDQRELIENWELASCAPDACAIDQIDSLDWLPAEVPGTVAAALNNSSQSNVVGANLDENDYWYRCRFDADPGTHTLRLDGLATFAEVWLNGDSLLTTENMFISHEVDANLRSKNELVIHFRSLTHALQEKRPRARWRTQLVAHRNLRYFRTSLLGRMPGICPAIPPVGPWRGVFVIRKDAPRLVAKRIRSNLIDGNQGIVDIELAFEGLAGEAASATALLGEHSVALTVSGESKLSGSIQIDAPRLWWPHTHGDPHLYPLTVRLQQNGEELEVPLPSVGFRTVALTDTLENFELAINGASIHSRGAVWMPADLHSLNPSSDHLREILLKCRDAGMNMLRITGISTYESEQFFELCDELGIMVWQDFMFARMDYPTEDPEFLASIETEARQVLNRIAHRPSLTVLCGGSEIRQQASMLGLPEDIADNPWFDTSLAEICNELRPDVIYCPHSPMGGALPFHADTGVGHYFGVGGYLQPLEAAELEPPRFASECLAFATPAEPHTLKEFFESDQFDWPGYEQGVPRDNGAEWSFADVTDHYLASLFSVNPSALKDAEPKLYLDASRIAVGETMKGAVEIWRRNQATTGALILSLNDLTAGSGWGVLDLDGNPKAPYYFLKRAWAPTALYFRDRRANGLWLGIHNDSPQPLTGTLTIELAKLDGKVLSSATVECSVPEMSRTERSVDELLGGFVDANYAYRFGGRTYEVAMATFDTSDQSLTEYQTLIDRPLRIDSPIEPTISINQETHPSGTELAISSDVFIDYLMLDVPGAVLSDNYISIVPAKPRKIVVSHPSNHTLEGTVRGFNGSATNQIVLGGAP